jgi:hypothetical protein
MLDESLLSPSLISHFGSFNIIYCFGVTTLSEHNLPYFEEHVCIGGDENSEKIHYRSKTCAKVLSFKNSNIKVCILRGHSEKIVFKISLKSL